MLDPGQKSDDQIDELKEELLDSATGISPRTCALARHPTTATNVAAETSDTPVTLISRRISSHPSA